MWYNLSYGLASLGLALVSFLVVRFLGKKHPALVSVLSFFFMIGTAVLMVLFFQSARNASVTHFFSKDAITWATLWPDLLLALIFLADAFFLMAPASSPIAMLKEHREADAPLLFLPGMLMPVFLIIGWALAFKTFESDFTKEHVTLVAIVAFLAVYFLCTLLGRLMVKKNEAPARYVWLYSAQAVLYWPILLAATIVGLVLLVSAFWKWIIAAIAAVVAILFVSSKFAKDALSPSSSTPQIYYDEAGVGHKNLNEQVQANRAIKKAKEKSLN